LKIRHGCTKRLDNVLALWNPTKCQVAYLGSDTTIGTVQVQMLEEYLSLKIVEILLSVDHVRFKSIDERRVFRKLN